MLLEYKNLFEVFIFGFATILAKEVVMRKKALEVIDLTLDTYASRLPIHSLTLQSIIREDAWGEIAAYARGEGLSKLARFLEEAESATFHVN